MRNKTQKQLVVLEAMDYNNEYIAKRLGYCSGYISGLKSSNKISNKFRKKFEQEFSFELQSISNMRKENQELKRQVQEYRNRLIQITQVAVG